MTRRGLGNPQIEGDFMDLLIKAGLSIQQARLALSNPVVARELVTLIKYEAKSNATAQITIEKHEPYALDRLRSIFLGGITDAYGSPESWKDELLDADHKRRHSRLFAAKRHKNTVKSRAEIVEPFHAAGFREANLHDGCAYLAHHLNEVHAGNVECQRDLVLLGTTVIQDGKSYVPSLTVRSPSATKIYDYRLEFVPAEQAWGLGEWFLFVQLPSPEKGHPPDHVF